MTKLSVNINKIATLRNARGGNLPDVVKAALDCEEYGAQGITVHPRPDERHIRYADVSYLGHHTEGHWGITIIGVNNTSSSEGFYLIDSVLHDIRHVAFWRDCLYLLVKGNIFYCPR